MKFCLERGSSSGRRAQPWDLVLRSWPVDLIGGRRLCSTWSWLSTMAEKRVSSACPQSSDSGGVDGDKNPSLCALVKMTWRRCLSDASVKPHQTGESYSKRFFDSIQEPWKVNLKLIHVSASNTSARFYKSTFQPSAMWGPIMSILVPLIYLFLLLYKDCNASCYSFSSATFVACYLYAVFN